MVHFSPNLSRQDDFGVVMKILPRNNNKWREGVSSSFQREGGFQLHGVLILAREGYPLLLIATFACDKLRNGFLPLEQWWESMGLLTGWFPPLWA